jgi:hypothetical protein
MAGASTADDPSADFSTYVSLAGKDNCRFSVRPVIDVSSQSADSRVISAEIGP